MDLDLGEGRGVIQLEFSSHDLHALADNVVYPVARRYRLTEEEALVMLESLERETGLV